MDLFELSDIDEQNKKFKRIKELEKLIKKYQDSYYNGEAEISDAQFDLLWDELKSLDSDNILFKTVGSDSINFKKINHVMPMGSQEKASNPEQFASWAENHIYDEYFVEYKLDGASLELQYSEGILIHAVTRGDGVKGDEITENARKMNGVIQELKIDGKKINFTGGIRGEVIMTHEVHKKFFSDKANCRNAANGLMKRKDGSGSEYLTLIVYDSLSLGESFFSDEEEKINFLKKCGFNVCQLKICKSVKEVIDYRSYVMDIRKNLEYDIDGLVIKERKINQEDMKRTRPDRQIAFKFSLDEAVSTLRSVEWSINGATYTPVAIFDSVELNGTTVKRASFSNPDTMKNLGAKIGCKVVVVKRGEIIPKIENCIHEDVSIEKEIEIPCRCETCGSALVNDGTRLFCPNKECSKRLLHAILKWVSVIDIRDLGETLVQNLFNKGKIRKISDLYHLTLDDLIPFFLNEESIAMEKKSLGAEKVLKSIDNHRTVSLSAFIAGFDIEGIGETTVDKLVSSGYDNLEKILNLSEEEIASVYGFAKVMAKTLVQGLLENKEEMLYLSKNFIKIKENNSGALKNISFCFTGELKTLKRQDAEKMVKEAGGIVKSSVTKDLNYLVTNDTSSGSSKNEKARKLSVPVISEEEFLKLFNES